jgi:hypothetical protein
MTIDEAIRKMEEDLVVLKRARDVLATYEDELAPVQVGAAPIAPGNVTVEQHADPPPAEPAALPIAIIPAADTERMAAWMAHTLPVALPPALDAAKRAARDHCRVHLLDEHGQPIAADEAQT